MQNTISISDSKFLWIIWLIPRVVIWVSVFLCFFDFGAGFNAGFIVLAAACFANIRYSFKSFTQKYKNNPVVKITQCYPTLWEIGFKNGKTQKIQLSRYYRTRYLIILVYQPLCLPSHAFFSFSRLSTLVLPYDSLSEPDYQRLAALLWPG